MNTLKTLEISLEKAFQIHRDIPEFSEASEICYFTDRLNSHTPIILGGYIDDILAGYIVAYNKYNDGSLYCWMVGVIPEQRKSGILGNMLKHLENIAKNKGYNSISIKTRNTRREMLSFLVKNNFLFTDVTPYTPIHENRISLKKII